MSDVKISNIDFNSFETQFKDSALLDHFYTNNSNILAFLNDKGVIKSINHSFIKKLKYKNEEIINRKINIISNEIDIPEIIRNLTIDPCYIWSYLIKAKNKENEILHLNAEINLLSDQKGSSHILLFSAEDRTEYYRLENKLEEKNRRLESIFQAFPGELILMSSEGIIKEHFMTGMENNKFYEDDYLGKNLKELMPENVYNILIDAAQKSIKTLSATNCEYSIVTDHNEKHYESRIIPDKNGDVLNIVREISDKKKTENEILLLISALEAADNAILITNKKGEIIWVNKAFTKLTYYTYPEVKGKNPRILNSGLHDKDVYSKLWDTINCGKSWYGHLYNKRKDDSIYIDEQTITPIIDDSGNITNFIAIKHDRSILEKLEEQLDFHLGLWNLLEDAIIVLDNNYKIVLWNKGAEKIFGWKFSEVIGQKFLNDGDSNNLFSFSDEIFKELLETSEVRIDTIQKNKRGARLNIESLFSAIKNNDKKLLGFIVINKDVTDKKEMIEEIRKDKGLLQSLFDSAAASILVLDHNKEIVMFNKAVLNYLNVSSEIFQGKKVSEIFPESKDTGSEWITRCENIFAGQSLKRYEDPVIIKGSAKYIRASFFPINDGKGQVYLTGIIFTDITAEKLAEKKYLETEKLTTIGKMAAYISHEMKTPLSSINLNIDILNKSLKLSPVRQKSFDIIRKEVKRLSRLMKNILQFSKADTINILSEISISNTINNIKILLNPILQNKKINLINNIDDIRIQFNSEKLESVFIHLIENSIDAVPQGGEIYLYAERCTDKKQICIYIKDNGCGIKEPEKIFHPFYTTKKDGTGLGMAIVKNILLHNNGDISLISSKKGETIFKIMLKI